MSDSRVVIFDTTLRDGEQSPGISLTVEDKVDIALQLERLGVDVIEAGFAASSTGDFEAIRAVASRVEGSVVCSLSRAVDRDVDLTAEAVRPAPRRRIHIVLATSPLHMRYKLQMEPGEVLRRATAAVRRARAYVDDVEFSCEDATRSDPDFLAEVVETVVEAGATTVSLPDTVGISTPEEYGSMIAGLRRTVRNADACVFSAHCHDDLGLAVANSLAAAAAGARQLECTVNGIGERAGNASLEEIVMALRTRHDRYGLTNRVDTRQIVASSQLVAERTGFVVQANKAIVGRNAFAHESGIHQDGMLKHAGTYQIMDAADVGWTDYRLVLGKHSGRNGLRAYMRALGVEFESEDELDAMFVRFKALADRQPSVDPGDLLALVGRGA